ncbi:MAG: tRNA (adenosine(37)-N6)-threonylcarbamoyltransferase complex dimerization subunit type 1 TsaB [Rhodobacteraceae bacterium]|nr:tRNA (adenosine(37)-N6)-threonylcarbamoyltransferase complex dimerization subunit type 1 TsaB [Paracoccaceae bacterium]MCY4137113.1 tRNA (adenosine(37)-N6)-threonylcarbamoyltransferase complex dimerization subunit type 1 TsaB [Paracoccaceae bacterium]
MRRDRTVLAFDTAREHCAAILVSGGEPVGHVIDFMKRGQAERLFPMLEDFLGARRISWSDLAAIGVGTGPGTFTGTRIAVSAARGLALALGIPAIGSSRFEAVAFLAHESGIAGSGDRILCAVDLQFNRIATQAFTAAPIPKGLDEPLVRDTCAFEAEKGTSATTATSSAGEISLFRELSGDVPGFLTTLGMLTWTKLVEGGTYPRPLPLYLRPPAATPAMPSAVRSGRPG